MKWRRVRVSRVFLLLCAWLLYRDRTGVFWQGLLACTLHELGHLGALAALKLPVRRVNVTPFGVQIELGMGLSYLQELFVAAAGPAVNLMLAFAFGRLPDGAQFAGLNLVLTVFNLLPCKELDGARVLRCLLRLLCPVRTADGMCRAADGLCTAIFILCGVFAGGKTGNVTLMLVCLWLLWRPGRKKRLDFPEKERNRSCHAVWKRLKLWVRY